MFKIVIPETPEEATTCACYGCHGNYIKTLYVFQSRMVGGKMRTISNHGVAINLCRDCRRELSRMFEEIDS